LNTHSRQHTMHPPVLFHPTVFEGQVVVVSGACGGIGREVARSFLAHGARVIGLDLNLEGSVVGDLTHSLELDLTDPAVVEHALGDLGGRWGRIDALVNCAAIYRREASAAVADGGTWQATLDVNLRGLLALCRTTVRWMPAGSSIVNVGSVRGRTAARGAVAYSVSKAMVEQATQMLALEWAARGIRVNGVAPGDIETPMNPRRPNDPAQQQLLARCPLGRMGQPEEVAGAILFLCSPLASFVHGTTLRVDGGFLAH
jgi:NAD(P)-dependent dehydrogenase (short-subunit alcohol dehydrogenase family)